MTDNADLLDKHMPKSNNDWYLNEKEHYREPEAYEIKNDLDNIARKIARLNLNNFFKERGNTDENRITGFEQEKEAIAYVIETADYISNIPQNEAIKLPKTILKGMLDSLSELNHTLRQMRNFHEQEIPKGGLETERKTSLQHKRDNLSSTFHDLLFSFQKVAHHFISLSSRNDIEALKEQVNKLTDAQTKEGIEKHNTLFRKKASDHFEAGWFWLIIGAALTLIALQFGYDTLQEIDTLASKPPKDTNDHLQFSLILLRIFMFGFLASLIFWSFKNYRLNKHNELLNTQKALALQTFTEFSNAASIDTDMRRAILGKMTTTIFDIHDMGYISNDNPSPAKESDILNTLMKLIAKKEAG